MSQAGAAKLTVDPYDPAFQLDPYPTYAQLRATSPVHRVTDPDVWLISRHEDVNWALRNPEDFSSSYGVAFGRSGGVGSLIATDDPDHTRLRRLLSRQFTPRSVAVLERQVATVVQSLIADLPTAGPFDLVQELSAPLPTRVIAEYLGIDPERWRDYKRWSDVLNEASWAREVSPALGAQALAAVTEAASFFVEQIAHRRSLPAEDLIGRLVAAADTADALTEDEIVNFCVLLMLAGNVTTASVLSHAVLLLLSHPEQLARIQREPSLIEAAIEETVRVESPIQGFVRTLTRDIEMHGQTLPAGDQVMLLFGSANRDEIAFTDAAQFIVARDTTGHVAFGAGPHFCLGSWLARLEVRLTLQALLPALSTWTLDPERPVVRTLSPAFREISQLPVFAGRCSEA